ncbi:MAG: TrkA family potassium uptake protein [Clostridiales bacterium]|nr:TrkA family potassium uptake protein [Clostridiales bacterium]
MRSNSYLVFGLGRFGSSLARSLCEQGQQVMAIDTNEELVQDIAPYVTEAIQLDATDEVALGSLGINNFDGAVVSIGQNIRDSILICVLLKEMGIPLLIAKASDEVHAKVLRKIGVDRVVFPERDMGERVARSLTSPGVLELMQLDNDFQIVEIRMPEKWAGSSLMELKIRRRYGISVLAIHRGGSYIVSPEAEQLLQEGDVLLVLGKLEDIEKLNA